MQSDNILIHIPTLKKKKEESATKLGDGLSFLFLFSIIFILPVAQT